MKSKKAQKNAQFISYTKHPLYQYISNQLKNIANQISESKTKQSNLELFLKQTYQGQNSPQNLELLDFQNFNLNQQQSPKNINDIENSNLQNKNQQIQHQEQIKEEIDNQLRQLLNNLIQKCKQLHKKETIEKLEQDMKNNSLEQLNQSIQQLSEQELKIQLEIFINESEINKLQQQSNEVLQKINQFYKKLDLKMEDFPYFTYQQFYEDIIDLSKEVDFTSEFYQKIQNNIIFNFIAMSLSLKPMSMEMREKKIIQYISEINKNLENNLEQLVQIEYPDLFLDKTQQIARILPITQTFETKKRVPFKLIFEVLDIKEYQLKHKQDKLYQQQQQQFNKNNNSNNQNQQSSLTNLDLQRLENNLNRMVSYQPPENIKIRKTSYDFCNIFQKSQQSKLKLIETTRNDSNKSDFLPSDNPQSKYYKLYQLSQFQDKNLDSNNSTSPDSNNNSNSSDEEIEEHMNFKLKNYSFYQNWSQEKIKNFKKNFKQFSQKFPQHHQYKTYRKYSLQEEQNQLRIQRKQSYKQDLYDYPVNYKYQYVKRNVTLKEKIRFLRKLEEKFVNKKDSINKIFNKLNYDLIEKHLNKLSNKQNNKNNSDSDDNQKCKTISNILDQQQSNESLIIEDTDENTEFPRKLGPWGELWEDASQIIIKNSPYSQYKSYQLKSYIIKGDDDVRQEYVAMRLIQTFKQIFQQANLNLWLKDYQIIPTSADSGIIEFLPDTQSIDSIKKKIPGISLDELFKETFLQQKEINTVQDNFMQSLAAYSIICYILQIKDRHNGNILIDSKGHLIHIDFGFILGISPGGISFEKAPFKLTKEYATVLGGKNSDKYQKFEQLFTQGMQEIKKQENIDLIKKELNALKEEFCDLQCFKKFDEQAFFDRFMDEPSKLLKDSYNNWKTTGYDLFQYTTNGIQK